MTSTLAQRVKERMLATGLKNAELARLAKVKEPTSFNWGSGKTKSIKGEPLLRAAQALGVTPGWLATGTGPKFPTESAPPPSGPLKAEDAPATHNPFEPDWAEQAAAIVRGLPPAVASEAVAYLRWLSSRHTPR